MSDFPFPLPTEAEMRLALIEHGEGKPDAGRSPLVIHCDPGNTEIVRQMAHLLMSEPGLHGAVIIHDFGTRGEPLPPTPEERFIQEVRAIKTIVAPSADARGREPRNRHEKRKLRATGEI